MRPARIVLIEDNPADVLLVRLALEENRIPHTLIEFESGADAVDSLCQPTSEPELRPDAILLDLNTPRSNGIEVMTCLRQQFAHVPITIVTSSRARSDKAAAASRGADYMEKPSDLQAFIAAIGQAVRKMLNESTSRLKS